MRIQLQNQESLTNNNDDDNKINYENQKLTKCAKMTEEAEKLRNGINGAAAANIHLHNFTSYNNRSGGGPLDVSGPHKSSIGNDLVVDGSGAVLNSTNNSTIAPIPASTIAKVGGSYGSTTTAAVGGRLQFFKDGKFILEIARSKEGEKMGWVSVPRKTYWPPAASLTNSANQKNESSTSLSFSDDNSSVQSSPWQRDHCWKQASPRRNISKEMAIYYRRPPGYTLSPKFYKTAQLKRRRPYDKRSTELSVLEHKKNGVNQNQLETEKTNYNENINVKEEIMEEDDQKEKENSERSDDKTMVKTISESLFKRRQPNKQLKNRQKLSVILQRLIDRIPEGIVLLSVSGPSAVVNHFTSNNSRIDLYHHQQHVSPRKRILRELEKVSLEDLATMKRSRAKGTTVGSTMHSIASPQTSSSSSPANLSHSISAGIASQQINFPYTTASSSKTVNGSHNEINVSQAPATQPTSRPISSYSITSLLGHNNNVNVKQEPHSGSNNQKDVTMVDQRTALASPKSPISLPSQQTTQKPTSAFSSKKKSPSYSGNNSSCLSPNIPSNSSSLMNHYSRNASLHSPINYGRNLSPDLSPSPEQIYARYRQSHGISTSVSSPSSTGFHPYLSSTTSSRCSPSGALSPPSSDTLRYRSNIIPGSPSHQSYGSSTQNSNSPLSYSRYSPSGYSQISPQHYSGSKTSHASPNFSLNNLINSPAATVSKARDISPNSSKSEHQRDTFRTVPKKTAALRQQYESRVSSPSSDSKPNDSYYKPTSQSTATEQSNRKNSDGPGLASLNLSRSRSPEAVKYEKDYRALNVSNTNPSMIPPGLDMDSNSGVIRPSLMPSLQHSQNMYYMYAPPTASSVGMAASSPFLPPVYYHSMALAAGAYRNPLWMHFPSSVPPSSRLQAQMLAYGSGIGPPSTVATSAIPWATMPHHTLLPDDPVSLVRIKDEPSSDVPLNLSKH